MNTAENRENFDTVLQVLKLSRQSGILFEEVYQKKSVLNYILYYYHYYYCYYYSILLKKIKINISSIY